MRQNYRKDEASARVGKGEAIRRILLECGKYRKSVALITIAALVNAYVKAIIPKFTERAVDVDIANGDISGLTRTVIYALLCCLVWGVTNIIREKLTVKIAGEVVYNIRTRAYDNIMSLPLGFFDSRPSGRIITRVINDSDKLKEITKSLTSNLLPNLFVLVLIIVNMFSMNVRLATATLLVLPLLAAFCYFIIVKNYENWENFSKKESNFNAFVHEEYAGIRPVQSFCAEEETKEECTRLLGESLEMWKKAVRRGDVFGIMIHFSLAAGYAFIFITAVFFMEPGTVSVGQLFAFITYVSLFWQPVRSLASLYNQLNNNLSSAARVFEIIDEKSDITEKDGAVTLSADKGAVSFENVTFSYPDDDSVNVIENLSFTVEGGRTVALVGPTGAGKTTIVNLIARFYDTVSGTVRIDGTDVSCVTFSSLRNTVSVMPQDSVLFTGTIRDNLLYGRIVDESVMEEKVKELGLEGLIASLPKGYDTPVMDAGLSGGQKQLLALARTLIADPKVLILDEATSNVDTRTELMVQRGLRVLMKGRTSFIVAHRLSTIRSADEIFVVGDRTILERGNHDTLMEKEGGVYRALYEAQVARVDGR